MTDTSTRNNSLCVLANGMLQGGSSREDITTAVQEANAAFDSPLPEEEISDLLSTILGPEPQASDDA